MPTVRLSTDVLATNATGLNMSGGYGYGWGQDSYRENPDWRKGPPEQTDWQTQLKTLPSDSS